jgi:hypothetical protein
MLQAHSLLWHYLWVGPHVLQLGLALLLWLRGLHRQFPFFFAYLILEAGEEFTLYGLDIAPRVSSATWWHAFLAGSVLEGLLRFAIIAELLRLLLQRWPVLVRLGRNLVGGVGGALILFAAVTDALRDPNQTNLLIKIGHDLQQSFFLVQAGLILCIFLFAAYFHVVWQRVALGIALGFAVVWCEHLAVWTVLTTGILTPARAPLDMMNMATYHVAVLIWFYYVLVPEDAAGRPAQPLPDPNLDLWNHELERLLLP